MKIQTKQLDLSRDLEFSGGNILLDDGKILVGNGSENFPSVSFTDGISSGMFLADGEIGFSVGGQTKVYLQSDGTVEFTGTTGLAIQAGTTAERPQNALEGLLRYNLDSNRFEAFIDNVWVLISTSIELAEAIKRDGSIAMTGTLNMNSQNIINAGTVNGVTVQSHAARHLPNGSDALTTAPAVGLTLSTTNTAGTANSFSRSDHTHQITGVQPLDSDLTAIAGLNTTGLIVRAGNGVAATRTIVGNGNIVVTNGDGVNGNPTISLTSTGVTAGTYERVVVDSTGRVTSGTIKRDVFSSIRMDTPTTSGNWPVQTTAPAYLDPIYTSLTVRGFDDSRSEGVGLNAYIPAGISNVNIRIMGRPRTTPTSNQNAVFHVYTRRYPENATSPAWSSAISLGTITVAANNGNFVATTFNRSLASLSLQAGEFAQIEVVRAGADGADTLSGDYIVQVIILEWS
jgi:hypothetical protein